MGEREARIRDEAYRIWVDAGRPEGDDQRWWYEAEKRVDASAGTGAKPARKKAGAEPKTVRVVARNAGDSGVASPAARATKGEVVDVAPLKRPIRAPRKARPKPDAS